MLSNAPEEGDEVLGTAPHAANESEAIKLIADNLK
jgi:hypothetical protein